MEFEIHSTVELPIESDIEKFKNHCNAIGVKPIIIQTQNGSRLDHQVMTASKHVFDDYLPTLKSQYETLQGFGYTIIRQKVEKRPEEQSDTNFKYYETHFRLRLPKDYNRSDLSSMCDKFDVHMSRNLFKSDEFFDYQMITHRTPTNSYTGFMSVVQMIKSELDKMGIHYDKVEIEECIYDSNECIDDSWFKNIW